MVRFLISVSETLNPDITFHCLCTILLEISQYCCRSQYILDVFPYVIDIIQMHISWVGWTSTNISVFHLLRYIREHLKCLKSNMKHFLSYLWLSFWKEKLKIWHIKGGGIVLRSYINGLIEHEMEILKLIKKNTERYHN